MHVHRIHLKGPWEVEWLGPAESPPAAATSSGIAAANRENRARMPAAWQSLFGDAAGIARFRRRFNRPTNLDADERVFLVFDGLAGRASLSLNGDALGSVEAAACPAEFDVTPRLAARNTLTVEVVFDPAHHPGRPGGLWAPVALEIRRPSPD